MKTAKTLLFVFLLSFVVAACDKDDSDFESHHIEIRLKEFVNSNDLTKCTIREHQGASWWEPVRYSDFEFENGFIIVTDIYNVESRYNLKYVYKYWKQTDDVLYIELVKG